MPQLLELAYQVRILASAGLIDLARPARMYAQARAVSSLGPVAGPVAVGARLHPHRGALVDAGITLTYAELDRGGRALAQAWRDQGVNGRSVVAILGRDSADVVRAIVAAARVGARAVFMNTGFAGPQLAAVSDREGVTAIWSSPEFDDVVAEVSPATTRLARTGAAAPPDAAMRPRSAGGFVILTGGTTGTPKGVPRRVQNPLIAAQFLDRVPLRRGERMLVCAPLFHGTAFSQVCLALALGSTLIIHRRFDAARALDELVLYRCSSVVLIPTMLRRMIAVDPPRSTIDAIAEHLRVAFCAGEALPIETGERARDVLGPVIYNFYGTTETGTASIATPQDWAAAPGTVGRPPIGVRERILGPDDRVLPAGVFGSVYVRNSMAFDGYSDGRTKRMVDGFYDTGDVGGFDRSGRLFIEGRSDDMIVSGGENVFPVEVEDVLARHPAVDEVAVVGIDDTDFGKRLAAFVVARKTVTPDELRDHVRAKLARFKVPRDVVFLDSLPRTATGKIDRSALSVGAVPRSDSADT